MGIAATFHRLRRPVPLPSVDDFDECVCVDFRKCGSRVRQLLRGLGLMQGGDLQGATLVSVGGAVVAVEIEVRMGPWIDSEFFEGRIGRTFS